MSNPAWDPTGFEGPVQQIVARAGEASVRRWREHVATELEKLGVRGMGSGGAALSLKNRAAVETVREFGEVIGRELINLVRRVYGRIPYESVAWIQEIVAARVSGVAR